MGDGGNKDKCLKKSNFLVYQQPTGQRIERKEERCKKGVKIPICKPEPKQIKICTGAELRKMSPLNVCPCDPVKKVPSPGMMKVLGFGAKSVIAAAAIYVTYDMGIWGSTDDTQQLYNTACHIWGAPKPRRNDKWEPPSCEAESSFFTRPKFSPYGHCDDPPFQAEESYLKFKNIWNGAIYKLFHGIAGFPGNLLNRMSSDESDESRHPICVPETKEEHQKIHNQYKS